MTLWHIKGKTKEKTHKHQEKHVLPSHIMAHSLEK